MCLLNLKQKAERERRRQSKLWNSIKFNKWGRERERKRGGLAGDEEEGDKIAFINCGSKKIKS